MEVSLIDCAQNMDKSTVTLHNSAFWIFDVRISAAVTSGHVWIRWQIFQLAANANKVDLPSTGAPHRQILHTRTSLNKTEKTTLKERWWFWDYNMIIKQNLAYRKKERVFQILAFGGKKWTKALGIDIPCL